MQFDQPNPEKNLKKSENFSKKIICFILKILKIVSIGGKK